MGHSQWRNFLFIQAIVAHICVLRPAASVSVRFKSNQCYGQVQIGDSDSETFDDDRWDFNNSEVLCRNSNCGTALKSQATPTPKNPDFLCMGNEKSFIECQRNNNKTQSSANKPVVVCSDAFSPPRISLTLPNGTSINSSHAEIPRGSSFAIKCTVDSIPDRSKTFSLKYIGNSTNITELKSNRTASFNISVADYNNEGNYSCTYEVNLNEIYKSDESGWIHVIVRDPWWKLLLYILPAGVLVLLLMVLLVACLVCRRRKRAEKPSGVVLNQVTVRNSCIDDEEEEDYVNVEPVETNSLGTEEMDEKDNDSHDYEDPEQDKSDSSDDEHDYEDPNVGPVAPADATKEQSEEEDSSDEHDYENPNVGPVAPADATKEQSEEEDSSDDGEDYVNLVEQTVDIYGEELDIYQNL
ncbi:uncharacterized protein LOC114149510 [Xiphophorus couchianus]|uniref:uncharacterized protein LOC114149510 n=1 Tax=Xiphophorus couchianus TaxID=32473 RepID=UPI001016446A|nr:uncharacterized protein LOC114149510 [Xiphophorus couchianus]